MISELKKKTNLDRGKVSRSKDGLYYKIKKYPELGGRSKKFSSMVSAAEVYRKMAEFEAALASGDVETSPASPLVSELAYIWLAAQENRVSPLTYRKIYLAAVKAMSASRLGSVEVAALSSRDLQRFVDSEAARPGKSGGAVSRSTINNRLIVLRLFCRWLVSEGYCDEDYSAALSVPALPPAEKVRALSRADAQKIIDGASAASPVSVLFLVLLCQGLRIGEALALTPADVDLDAATMSISRTCYHIGNSAYIKNAPKTDAGRRVIPLVGPVLSMFRENGLSYLIGDDSGYIFGLPSFSRYRDACERYAKELSLPDGFHLHMLRHSCATILYDSGVDALAASAILGHSSYRVTADVYTDIQRERLDAAAADVSRYLSGGPEVDHVRLSEGFAPDWARASLEPGDRLRVEYSADRIVIVRE